jgi:hypothetical protein
MSWQASAVAVAVLLLQQTLGRAVSLRWRHTLWVLVLLLPENLRSHLAAVRNAGRMRRDQFLSEAD